MMVMVDRVVTPNTIVTPATVQLSPLAAAYMRIGIKGSHGPKRKMVNNTQGVTPVRRGPATKPRSHEATKQTEAGTEVQRREVARAGTANNR
jgi:hypothetical protein